ncbi:tyrosine-type recombinase/integrase [Methylocaldum sp. 14B]|uniref:tyrosine-type recombinase/integrase n=1 Tax=Methylocaldum sp. 14B TaxID=1912213 RepID=UPI00197C26EE|nr:tyrosine-type recombinase/integrase [Methylocaldum sp. 14B]
MVKCHRSFVERSEIELPEGQMSHVLRHTFASQLMMNGGNILALKRILGHANLTMTMRILRRIFCGKCSNLIL